MNSDNLLVLPAKFVDLLRNAWVGFPTNQSTQPCLYSQVNGTHTPNPRVHQRIGLSPAFGARRTMAAFFLDLHPILQIGRPGGTVSQNRPQSSPPDYDYGPTEKKRQPCNVGANAIDPITVYLGSNRRNHRDCLLLVFSIHISISPFSPHYTNAKPPAPTPSADGRSPPLPC